MKFNFLKLSLQTQQRIRMLSVFLLHTWDGILIVLKTQDPG
jgi:hypothetical protein